MDKKKTVKTTPLHYCSRMNNYHLYKSVLKIQWQEMDSLWTTYKCTCTVMYSICTYIRIRNICVYICICTYTCIYLYLTYVHIYTYTHMNICINIYMHVDIYVHVLIYLHILHSPSDLFSLSNEITSCNNVPTFTDFNIVLGSTKT